MIYEPAGLIALLALIMSTKLDISCKFIIAIFPEPEIGYCLQKAVSQSPAGTKLLQHSINQPALTT